MSADLFGPGLTVVGGATTNAVTTRPSDNRTLGSTDTWFKDCTSVTAQDGTSIIAAFLDGLLAQLRSVARGNNLKADGVTPVLADANADTQLLTAIQLLIQRGQMGLAKDSGTQNHVVLALNPAPPELIDGMAIAFKAKFSNNGPSDLTIGASTYSFTTLAGSAFVGGEITAGGWHMGRVAIAADGTTTTIQLVAPSAARRRFTGTAVMAGTTLTATVSPVPTVLVDFDTFDLVPNAVNAGIIASCPVNGLTGLPIKYRDGTDFYPGELQPNQPITLMKLGANLLLMSPPNPLRAAVFTTSAHTEQFVSNSVLTAYVMPAASCGFGAWSSTSFTFTVGGLYNISGALTFSVSFSGVTNMTFQIALGLSGATIAAEEDGDYGSGSPANGGYLTASTTVFVAAGSVLTLNGLVQSGNYVAGALESGSITITKIV